MWVRLSLDGCGGGTPDRSEVQGAPAGHARWTLRLVADQAVALDIVETSSHETVSHTLKKMR